MNENEEIWKPICGFEGLYEISNFGRIKSLKYGKEKILKQGKNTNGYLIVLLYKNGESKHFKIHRLVAQTFLPNPNNLPQVNHKDEDKTNNVVDNLEWCDAKYNNNYGTCQLRRVANIDYKARTANTDYKLRTANTDWKSIVEKLSKQVYQYSKDGNLIKIWNSTAECNRNGYSSSHVSACCRNSYLREGNNVYKGFLWSYTELKKNN